MTDAARALSLTHYSSSPFTLERRDYSQERQTRLSCFEKPVGLWVSVDNEFDWPEFCQTEGFRLTALRHASRVALTADANVPVLAGPTRLAELEATYGVQDPDPLFHRYTSIDWHRFAQDHDGIIITPYLWSERLSRMWYYTWDCASGCIWNTNVITQEDAHE